MPRGDQATATIHRQWLRDVAATTRKPLTRIAKEINVSPSTLTRPVAEGEDGTSTLHARTIAKIVAHTGIAPPQPFPGSHHLGRPPIGLGGDAIPFDTGTADPISTAVLALIGARNGVSAVTLHSHALELAGYLPGDVVLLDRNATPQSGDIVLAEIEEWPRHTAKTVLRMLQRAAPIDLLIARSLDPAFLPIVVDGERVTIKGVILPHRLRP